MAAPCGATIFLRQVNFTLAKYKIPITSANGLYGSVNREVGKVFVGIFYFLFVQVYNEFDCELKTTELHVLLHA